MNECYLRTITFTINSNDGYDNVQLELIIYYPWLFVIVMKENFLREGVECRDNIVEIKKILRRVDCRLDVTRKPPIIGLCIL